MNKSKQIADILNNFDIEGKVLSVCRYGEGHINTTYLVTTDKKRFILQRINNSVFPNVDGLMHNIYGVTSHLKKMGVETLNIVRTKNGEIYFKGDEPYRIYDFIENTVTYQSSDNVEMFACSGEAFGKFQNYLASYDASALVETIPRFHDTPKRFTDFVRALEEDKMGRASACRKEIDFVLSRESTYGTIINELKSGSLPLRVTHNDTKLNNVLMDAKTNKARAVIDLDTVMPGSMLYDFGDSIRFGACDNKEDEPDVAKVKFNRDKFIAYAKGYCNAVKDSITAREAELLPFGAYLMTIECGMRFLTDYLNGDVYFKTTRAGQNLDRCCTQLCLATKIYDSIPELQEVVYSILK